MSFCEKGCWCCPGCCEMFVAVKCVPYKNGLPGLLLLSGLLLFDKVANSQKMNLSLFSAERCVGR